MTQAAAQAFDTQPPSKRHVSMRLESGSTQMAAKREELPMAGSGFLLNNAWAPCTALNFKHSSSILLLVSLPKLIEAEGVSCKIRLWGRLILVVPSHPPQVLVFLGLVAVST